MRKIFAFGFIMIVAVLIAYYMTLNTKKPLPILNPIELNSEMVDSSLQSVGLGHKIGKFSFLNQDGETITEKNVKGKVFVAEYFFTTCGTICPKMNAQMQRVQLAYKGNSDFNILSFTVNPEVDLVPQMKMYAASHGAVKNQWHFLTGDKKDLYSLARKSFFVLKPAEAQNLGDAKSDFIHTNNFVLIDKQMRIRGYYEGTQPHQVDQLIKDIGQSLKEK